MLTIKDCRKVDSSRFRVVVVDDALPDQEGELVLRRGHRAEGEAALEVDSFTIRMRPEGIGRERINSSFLKFVPFGRWISIAAAAAGDLDEGRNMAVWTAPDPAKYRPRVRPVSDAPDLDVVAALYRVFLRTAERSPAEEIAKAYKATPAQAHQWLMHARRQGSLGPMAPRKPRRPSWVADDD